MNVAVHKWTASDGVELAWRETGEGRAVILLHGLLFDAQMNWTKCSDAERIAADSFPVIMSISARLPGPLRKAFYLALLH